MIPRIVVVLGLASCLNDAASEMVSPLLPLFLTTVLGAGAAIVGLVEGVAQSTAAVLRYVSGRLIDRGWSHGALIFTGYTVAGLARPAMGLAGAWPQVMGLRFVDRVGKGIRGTARDALISGSVVYAQRGLAFGLHRALDHTGAMLGPLAAFALLAYGFELREVFLFSLVPAIVLIALLARNLELRPLVRSVQSRPERLALHALDGRLKGVLAAAAALSLAAVPDAFLVLWASQQGVALVWIPLLWAAAHALRAMAALGMGRAADRFGRIGLLLAGWSVRIVLLLMLAFAGGHVGLGWALFLAYAFSTALTEPVEAALLGDLAPAEQRGALFGAYHLLSGLLLLPGALVFGLVWQYVDKSASFILSATLTVVASLAFLALARSPQP